MRYFKQFSNGTRTKAEYITAIVISLIIIIATIVVMPIIISFVNREYNVFMIWSVLIILSFGLAAPLAGYSILMIKAKKYNEFARDKAIKQLKTYFQPIKYKAYGTNRFARKVIQGTAIKFEAKMDKSGLITIRVLSPDGNVISTEETYDYTWFNDNFCSE